MQNFEDIYNEALEMLKAGRSQEEALVKYAQFKEELAPLLSLSAALMDMPKNIVPTPLMKRKYAMAKAQSFWLTWVHVPKFVGVSMSALLLISAAGVMGYQTLNSIPGQTLFPVRKSVENLRVVLAQSQDAKASAQIQIAQNRLNDAQEIFSNPNSNIEQKKAALTELADQTTNAISEVNSAAKNNPSSDKNHPLLNSLDSIATEQKNLLAEIKPDKQINSEANTALQTLDKNNVKISEIKQTVAAADNEQTLVKINAGQSTSTSTQGQVKDASTSTVAEIGLKKASGNDQTSSSTSETSKSNSSTAVGTFILEDPSPQFIK